MGKPADTNKAGVVKGVAFVSRSVGESERPAKYAGPPRLLTVRKMAEHPRGSLPAHACSGAGQSCAYVLVCACACVYVCVFGGGGKWEWWWVVVVARKFSHVLQKALIDQC